MKRAIKIIVTTFTGAVIALLVILNRGAFGQMALVERYRVLADACTIPGVLFLAIGTLVWLSGNGQFDGLTYAVGRLARMLLPFLEKNNEKYYEYKQRKNQKRIRGYGPLLIVGAGYLALAMLFIALFYSVY